MLKSERKAVKFAFLVFAVCEAIALLTLVFFQAHSLMGEEYG
jgi:hypothetical protein